MWASGYVCVHTLAPTDDRPPQMLRALARWKGLFLGLSLLLIVGLLLSRHLVGPKADSNEAVVRVSPGEATQHVGDRARVCGPVAEVVQVSEIGGAPTFINLEREHPDQSFTVLIWERDRRRWRVPPEEQYLNRDICVTGQIQLHEGTLQIIISSPQQIHVR